MVLARSQNSLHHVDTLGCSERVQVWSRGLVNALCESLLYKAVLAERGRRSIENAAVHRTNSKFRVFEAFAIRSSFAVEARSAA